MLLPSRGKNHLFIGVVDKSKYKKENLSNTLIVISIYVLEGFSKFFLLGCLEYKTY